MIYYGGMLWDEIYSLPVSYKRWMIERIGKEINKSNDGQSRAAHQNTPDIRAMQGKARAQVPSRLKRFT